MSETVEDLTIEYEENGKVLIKELDKKILSKGAWATVIYRFQVWRPETDDYGPDKFSIQRYHKTGGEYRKQTKFNISSADQARKIIEALSGWINEEGKER